MYNARLICGKKLRHIRLMIKPISDLPAHADIQPLGNYIENEKHIITARNIE